MASSSKIKSFFVPIFLVLTALLVSCTTPGTPQPGPEPANQLTSFVGGSNGLVISFIPGLPPPEIVDSSTGTPDAQSQGNFQVGVQLENVGEDDLLTPEAVAVDPQSPDALFHQSVQTDATLRNDYVFVTVEGLNPISFGASIADMTKRFSGTLRGKEKVADTVFPGDRERVIFPADNGLFNYRGQIPGTQTFPIQANVCYSYETLATARICLTNELFRRASPAQTKVCEGSGVKPVENWGAPVKVTRLEQTPIRDNKIAVTFDVEQVGAGQIFDVDNPPASCTGVSIGWENLVDFELARRIDPVFASLDCFPKEVRLINGRATVSCNLIVRPEAVGIDAEDSLVIRLRYGHMVSTQTQLTIFPDRSSIIE